MIAHSAKINFTDSLIASPNETIDFVPADSDENGFNEFSAISELLQKKLEENGSFLLNGIGTFIRDTTGVINFDAALVDPVFIPSVEAKRAIRKEHATHDILVGDQQTTNVQMTEYFREKAPLKDLWWLWAIVLGLIGMSVLIFYFYQHRGGGFGNVGY